MGRKKHPQLGIGIALFLIFAIAVGYFVYEQYKAEELTGFRGSLTPTVVIEHTDGTIEEIKPLSLVPLGLVYEGTNINAIYVKWTALAVVEDETGTVDYPPYTVGIKHGATLIDDQTYYAFDTGIALGISQELGGICSASKSDIKAVCPYGTYAITHYISGTATATVGAETYTANYSGSVDTTITLTEAVLSIVIVPSTPITW